KSQVTVSLTPSDANGLVAVSGVNQTYYKVDSGSYTQGTSVIIAAPSDGSNDGTHTITYYSTDNAGNAETAHTTTVKIDTTKPSSNDNAPSGWQNSPVTVHLSATDPGASSNPATGSGVASIKYSVDGGTLHTVNAASTDVLI